MPGLRETSGRGLVLSAKNEHPGAGHRERLRERFLAHGLAKFTDEEVLELLLTLATPRKDCKQPARELLGAFGNLQAVLDAEPKDLAKIKGIGPKNILGLKLVPAAARRYLEDRLVNSAQVFDLAQAGEYLALTMRPLSREIFRVMLLDGEKRVRGIEDLFMGTVNQAAVYPREVAARALAAQAAAVVCAHNHPTGGPRPSRADMALTRQLYFALRGVGVVLLDHLVVAASGMYSFAEAGEMERLNTEYQALNL